jgi:TrmH family RNA methyltransferase
MNKGEFFMYYSLTSPQNQQVKRWKKLHSKKGRQTYGTYLVEGVHLVEEAKKANAKLAAIIVDEKFDDKDHLLSFENREVPIYKLSSPIFSQIVETEQSQGIIAETHIPTVDFDEKLGTSSLLLLLDKLQDPGNLGTILRTASAAGVDMVILGDGTVDLYNSKVVRSTMGAMFHLPIFEMNLPNTLPKLKAENFTVVGTSPHNGVYSFDYIFPDKVAIVLGNEGRGIQLDLLEQLDRAIMVPMPGVAESYNVAVTSGILLYELIRQRFIAKNN